MRKAVATTPRSTVPAGQLAAGVPLPGGGGGGGGAGRRRRRHDRALAGRRDVGRPAGGERDEGAEEKQGTEFRHGGTPLVDMRGDSPKSTPADGRG